jgi:hypothetical protein
VQKGRSDIFWCATRHSSFQHLSRVPPAYQPGQDVSLRLAIINEGVTPDRLVAVSSPAATSARVNPKIQLSPSRVTTAGYREPDIYPDTNRIEIVLVKIREPIRTGLTYPVSFVFQNSGQLHLDIGVGSPPNPALRDRVPQA